MTILVVDDDPVQCRLLEGMLQKFDYQAVVRDNGDAALALLTSAEGADIDCVILDLVMPNLDGLGVLAKMRQASINVPVIVQTAHGGIDNVVSAMRAGAVDFVVKPVGAERLQVSLRNAINASALEGEIARMKHSRAGTLGLNDIITKSASMQSVLRMAEKVAASAIPVQIAGESGVGKELIARVIHGSGERRAKPFIAVNCGAMQENLVESILFGHEKGAFTGATDQRKGYFELADGGTIFLDEIGELPPATQVKFLRVLESGEFMRVGSSQTRTVDVRIIAATNRNLEQSVHMKTFRPDLFFRLRTVNIQVPPLREHREDIPVLAAAFAHEFSQRNAMPPTELGADTIAALMNYNWPGNVRELRNVIESLLVMHAGGAITAADVQKLLRGFSASQHDDRNLPVVLNKTTEQAERELIYRALIDMKADINEIKSLLANRPASRSVAVAPGFGNPAVETPGRRDDGENLTLDEMERRLISSALDKYLGNRRRAARALKISERTLYRKIKEYGLQG